MIPAFITKEHIVEAMRRICREDVPPRRKARDNCLVVGGSHFPPKYTISLAHEVVTGHRLRPNEFSGGAESNGFLRTRGFDIVDCNCGGSYRAGDFTPPSGVSKKTKRVNRPTRHSERCRICKIRVREILEADLRNVPDAA